MSPDVDHLDPDLPPNRDVSQAKGAAKPRLDIPSFVAHSILTLLTIFLCFLLHQQRNQLNFIGHLRMPSKLFKLARQL